MIEETTSSELQKADPQASSVSELHSRAGSCGSGTVVPDLAEAAGERPPDLVDYDEAALMVDRHRNRIRAWVREGQLRSWSEEPGKANAKRLVSGSELMRLVVVTGKTAHPGGPGRGEPVESPVLTEGNPAGQVVPLQVDGYATVLAPVPPTVQAPRIAPSLRSVAQESVALAHARLDAERAKVGMMEALVQAERQRAEALERALQAERERAEVERLRGGDWRDRATALQAEVEALRAERGLPWWRKLLTG
jgi:hypothetical protein